MKYYVVYYDEKNESRGKKVGSVEEGELLKQGIHMDKVLVIYNEHGEMLYESDLEDEEDTVICESDLRAKKIDIIYENNFGDKFL